MRLRLYVSQVSDASPCRARLAPRLLVGSSPPRASPPLVHVPAPAAGDHEHGEVVAGDLDRSGSLGLLVPVPREVGRMADPAARMGACRVPRARETRGWRTASCAASPRRAAMRGRWRLQRNRQPRLALRDGALDAGSVPGSRRCRRATRTPQARPRALHLEDDALRLLALPGPTGDRDEGRVAGIRRHSSTRISSQIACLPRSARCEHAIIAPGTP